LSQIVACSPWSRFYREGSPELAEAGRRRLVGGDGVVGEQEEAGAHPWVATAHLEVAREGGATRSSGSPVAARLAAGLRRLSAWARMRKGWREMRWMPWRSQLGSRWLEGAGRRWPRSSEASSPWPTMVVAALRWFAAHAGENGGGARRLRGQGGGAGGDSWPEACSTAAAVSSAHVHGRRAPWRGAKRGDNESEEENGERGRRAASLSPRPAASWAQLRRMATTGQTVAVAGRPLLARIKISATGLTEASAKFRLKQRSYPLHNS
jgi:hypothetical protein